jgi:ribosomal protein L32
MAVSKRKTSKSKNGMRQSGKGLRKKENLIFDDKRNLVGISHHKFFLEKRRKKEEQNKEVSSEKE